MHLENSTTPSLIFTRFDNFTGFDYYPVYKGLWALRFNQNEAIQAFHDKPTHSSKDLSGRERFTL